MARREWEERYIACETPWDSGRPDEHLVEFLRSGDVGKGRVLDVGSGTGTNGIWLPEQGFTVLGVDVAPAGIDKARAKLAGRECLRGVRQTAGASTRTDCSISALGRVLYVEAIALGPLAPSSLA